MTVSKRDKAEWKTIGQRERSQMRARKTQRRGEAAVTAGSSLAVGSMYMPGKMRASTGEKVYPPRQAKMIWDVARQKEQKYGTAGVDGFSLPFNRMERAKNTLSAIKKLPAGAMFGGGAALAGAGGVGIAQGRAREAFHQRKINERRKSRVKKDAPMDHESTGYARYGNFSSVGRKQTDEFSKSVVGHAEINFGRAARSAYGAMKNRKMSPEQYKTAYGNARAAYAGQGKKIKPTSDVRMPSRSQVNWNPKPKKAPLYNSAPGLVNKADNRKVSNGQRVKTFNGRKATIRREDHGPMQRAASYIGQAYNVANGHQGMILTPPHRSADAVGEKWWHRTGIRGTSTEDRKATELRLHQRSNGSRNAQRGVQILGMGGIGAGGGAIIAGRKGGVIGGLAGGTLGAALRPADRRLAFHRPVSKSQVVRDMRTKKGPGVMLRQNKDGVRQYMARGDDGKPTWKDFPAGSPFSKRIRNKDAESDRQRRLGAGIALTGTAGALLGSKGLLGAAKATRHSRKVSVNANDYRSLPPEAQKLFTRGKPGKEGYSMGNGLMMSRRQLAEMGAGVGLLGASGATAGYARSERNRRWE